MVKQTAPIRVISFILLAACGVLCQKPPPSDSLGLQFDGSNSPEPQRQEMLTSQSLPDAPSSVQPPSSSAERFRPFVNKTGSPLTLGAVGVTPGPQAKLTAHYQAAFIQKGSGNFVGKDSYPPLLKQTLRYLPSTSSSFMGRATYAASRIFITRDGYGKGRLNTSYFLGVLATVASATAYRPYWARSSSTTFNNFGSTMGSDAGTNVLHEFGPGIRQRVRGFTPKFVSRMEGRLTHDQSPMGVVSIPAR